MENQPNNPLLCDVGSGVCEMPGTTSSTADRPIQIHQKAIKIIYFTDPICSSCWGIEPQLRKLKLSYGAYFDIEYRMGGLLPDWSYNSGGISKPSDVAGHWDEVSLHYDMPIDGDVWLEDPLDSSYPPSIAFKAAQLQGEKLAVAFLRELREMVFLQKKNIAKWEHLLSAAQKTGLDTVRFERDYHHGAPALFRQDLDLARQLGVRGFPTLFFSNAAGTQEKVYGTKPFAVYADTLARLLPGATATAIDPAWEKLFAQFPTLTSREYSELSQTERTGSELLLQGLSDAGHLDRLVTKNGSLWLRK